MRASAILRLAIAVIVFALALLAVVPAPSYLGWQLSIIATELGHLVAIIALLTLLPGWSQTKSGRVAAVFGLAALVMSLSPLVRSLPIVAAVPGDITRAFGASQPKSLPGARPLAKPIEFGTLFRKPKSPEVRVTTIPFVVRDGKPLDLDLYKRDREMGALPTVVMIYGGSWRGGTKKDLPALNFYLASRGYAVAAVSYRFAPAHPFPAATDDVNAAIDYLKTNSRQLGLDSTRMVLIGRSAGGQLALQSAYMKNDPSIKGVVGFYAPTDQKWGWEHPTNPRVYNSAITLRDFMHGDPSSAPDAYRLSSALNFVGPTTVPTLLFHGDADPLVSVQQSARLDSALAAAKRPHLFIRLPWATHGCDYFFTGPCSQISVYAIERFLASVM